jgi:uncharacterized protein with GYD domain
MPTYISLIHWTQKGIENVKDSPKRLDQAKAAFKAMGAELKQFYLVTGQYDIVVISEAPDDETVSKVAIAIGSAGSIRTETLRAFTEEEYRNIIASLP